jgi:hypothetical protein
VKIKQEGCKQTVEVSHAKQKKWKENQEVTTRRKFNDPKKAVNSLIKQAISEPFIHDLNVRDSYRTHHNL